MVTPELSNQKERVIPILGTLAFLGVVSFCAFSRPVRRKIWQRDGGHSVWSGTTDRLEVAHINHDKSDPRYNDESNGRLLNTGEHMWDHINRHGRNGLSEAQNNWAIMSIWKRFWGIK